MSQDQPIVLDPTYASFDAAARPADLGTTHFIGIGGAGMSVLAEMLHAEGRRAADRFLEKDGPSLGKQSSLDLDVLLEGV